MGAGMEILPIRRWNDVAAKTQDARQRRSAKDPQLALEERGILEPDTGPHNGRVCLRSFLFTWQCERDGGTDLRVLTRSAKTVSEGKGL